MAKSERITTPERTEDDTLESSLRPKTLADFVGQQQARENLKVFIEAAKARGEALDHVLFSGPPGLGKTTLAQIVARELGVNFRSTSGPVLAKAGDLAAILTNLEPRDVLFIDEIHRLNPAVEEILYPAMEDFELDLVIGEGPSARSVKIQLAPFTLVGATTRSGLITTPLRDRFGIPVRLNFYTADELLLDRGAGRARAGLRPDARTGAREIAGRARGTPRIAGRLLKRVRDFASVGKHAQRRCADRRCRAHPAGSGPQGPGWFRQALSHLDRGEFRRRPGRHRDHRRRPGRGARRHRGDRRAVSDAAGLRAAHAARAASDRSGLWPSGVGRAAARSRRRSAFFPTKAAHERSRAWAISTARPMSCRCASITRTPICRAWSITPIICATWSGPAPNSSAWPA